MLLRFFGIRLKTDNTKNRIIIYTSLVIQLVIAIYLCTLFVTLMKQPSQQEIQIKQQQIEIQKLKSELEHFTLEKQKREQPKLSRAIVQTTGNYLGEFTLTAYCSCHICCGEYANNRPGGVVRGSGGVPLKAGYHVASNLPNGTRVKIEGLGVYEVQDSPADFIVERYNHKIIDIYFDNHNEALKFGKQHRAVYKL